MRLFVGDLILIIFLYTTQFEAILFDGFDENEKLRWLFFGQFWTGSNQDTCTKR